ncbi:helix-turn-helix domain-containing protein [Kiloniella laminariae]|uniref:Helix-turn-helix domain-containing protein n=1 Tax=Kiloniella laminariae TaxID=454162 RepID=A0ABT4LER2_9PROT|nr:IclR family transcriptional regulator C-terminal domain-containing protein [Kiloniella laminariae]MCZ4279593.1 helix-turn-helix domain-containing protein [Kiloniella laminariae]
MSDKTELEKFPREARGEIPGVGDLTHRPVRALARGLSLLQLMNRLGPVTVQELSRQSRLNRTTVYRLLETLEAEGFVKRGAISSPLWSLTLAVRSLSEGYEQRDWVTQLGAPVLGELFKQVVWPTDIAVFDGRGMVIRETTHKFSPLSRNRNMVGVRWPLLTSSLGRAFFCFSTAEVQSSLLEALQNSELPEDARGRDKAFVQSLVKITRERGYAQSVDETDKGISSIALPVCSGDQVVASINLVFFTSAMTPRVAAVRYLDPMRSAVRQLEQSLAQNSLISDLSAPGPGEEGPLS